MAVWRLIHTPPGDPAWTMAVDEALWRGLADGAQPAITVHHFERESVTLGFGQPASDLERAGLAHLPWTRRITGGGAIHHRPGTLSFGVIGLDPPQGRNPGPIACRMGTLLAELCTRLGTPAKVLSASEDATLQAPLCANRRYAGDVMSGEVKVAGIGQRVRQGRLLVQCALMGLSISDDVDFGPLVGELVPTEITSDEKQMAASIQASRYSQPNWNRRI